MQISELRAQAIELAKKDFPFSIEATGTVDENCLVYDGRYFRSVVGYDGYGEDVSKFIYVIRPMNEDNIKSMNKEDLFINLKRLLYKFDYCGNFSTDMLQVWKKT